MQVFSALIVIVAGDFIVTIIYRSVLSFSEPHLQTREGDEQDGVGRRLPSLAMGHEEGPLWTRACGGTSLCLDSDASGIEGHLTSPGADSPHQALAVTCGPQAGLEFSLRAGPWHL